MKQFFRRSWTVRVRLTAVYGTLFITAATVLLGVTYVLLRAALDNQPIGGSIIYIDKPVDEAALKKELAKAATAAQLDAAQQQAARAKEGATPLSGATPLPGATAQPSGPSTGTAVSPDAAYAKKLAAIEAKSKVLMAEQLRYEFRDATLNSMLTRGGMALGTVGLVGLWVGWIAAGRTLRPVQQITGAARRVAGGNMRERIALGGPHDELRELADTFDSMLERLDRAFDGQRQFVANASHELKTPLAINRTLLEVAMARPDAPPQLQQLGQTLLEVNARHERLIDGLLTLARSEQQLADPEPVDLGEVTRHAVDAVRAEAGRRGIELRADLRDAVVAGDPVLLERLALNLMQNAVRHNVPDGWVSAACAPEPGGVRLTVENTGAEIPAYEIPALFQPFRRLAERVGSARGTGLGLSIVQSVARAHGGQATARPRAGGGLVVEVTLPARDGERPATTRTAGRPLADHR